VGERRRRGCRGHGHQTHFGIRDREHDQDVRRGRGPAPGLRNTANYSLDPATTGAPYDVLDQTSLNKIHSIVAHGLDSVPAGISSGGGGGGLSC
jgi:hypothetical protein